MQNIKHILITLLLIASLPILAQNTAPTFGIITAVPSEAQLITSKIHHKQTQTINKIHYMTGTINNKQVVLVIGGAGIINAAITTEELINNFHPQHIMFSGTAGGFGKNINVGDVILVDRAYFFDLGDQQLTNPVFPDFGPNPITHKSEKAIFTADSATIKAANTIASKIKLPAYSSTGNTVSAKIYPGSIATSLHFPSTKADMIKMRKLNIDAEAMETAAMFKVCWLYNQKCFAVRSISNKLFLNNQYNQYTGWNKVNARLASDNAGRVVVAIVSGFATTR